MIGSEISKHLEFVVFEFVVGSGEDTKVFREMTSENMKPKNQIQNQNKYDPIVSRHSSLSLN